MAYKPYTIPKAPSLAKTAAGAGTSDPFGLASGAAGLFGGTPKSAKPAYAPAQVDSSLAANPYASKGGYEGPVPMPPQYVVPQKQQTPSAPTFSYDINTDPAYQAAVSLVGKSDEQAKADAQKQIRDMLLAYGDPTLAGKSELGGDATLAQAAGQNPTSTVAQLGDQYKQGLQQFEQQLVPQNLTFSGYRVKQDEQAAKNYQNTLAQAAAGLNQNIGQVNQNLTAAEAANQQAQIQAANDAANRDWQLALQGLLAGAGGGGTGYGAPDPSLAAAAGGSNGAANAGSYGDKNPYGASAASLAAMFKRAQQNAAQPDRPGANNLLRGPILF